MLAYVYWHRPRDGQAQDTYERALLGLHRSLGHAPPFGLRGSASFRVEAWPWQPEQPELSYEDWYLVDDYTALGVLNEAAVGHGHRTPHDEVAHRSGEGAGGLYAFAGGDANSAIGAAGSLASWIARPAGAREPGVAELLEDGIDPAAASLWRRQMVLGPAPELCLLAHEPPAGLGATRIPAGWTVAHSQRVLLSDA